MSSLAAVSFQYSEPSRALIHEKSFFSRVAEAFGSVRISRIDDGAVRQTSCLISGEEFLSEPNAVSAVKRLEVELQKFLLSNSSSQLVSIPVFSENGFAVDIFVSKEQVRAWFGEMEVEFDSIKSAMIWVARALSSEFALHTISTGGTSFEWRLQSVEGSNADVLAAGHPIVFRSLRTLKTTVQRNLLPWGTVSL